MHRKVLLFYHINPCAETKKKARKKQTMNNEGRNNVIQLSV